MEKRTILEEIIDWVAELEYWEQYLAVKILNNQRIKDADIKAAYQHFLEDNDLSEKKDGRPAIKLPSFSGSASSSDFILKEIKNVEGVNALKEKQTIPVSKNLTIIYGDNGVGKSGYIRMLNQAFVSRGDKHIEPNIYSDDEPKETACTFTFSKGDTEYELKYPDDETNHEFGCYAVFDTTSISAHLNDEDEIQFLPSGLEFFDVYAKAVGGVKDLLSAAYVERTPENPFLVFFEEKETATKKIIEELSGDTDLKQLRARAVLSPEEVKSLDQLEKKLLELQKTNVGKRVKGLNNIQALLNQLRSQINGLNEYFSEATFEKYKNVLKKYSESKELSTKEGLEQFKTELISDTGSEEWKTLIEAAHDFACNQYEEEDAYPQKGDVCLLCRQPLSAEAKKLIEAYWKYLSSNAEKDLKKYSDLISSTESALKKMNLNILDKESVLYGWLEENADKELSIWITELVTVEALRKNILAALKDKKWKADLKPAQISVKKISIVEDVIKARISDLNEVEINKQIKDVGKKIDEFKDRKKLRPLLEKIEKYVNDLAWAKKAQANRFTTRKISDKQKELYSQFVTDEYVSLFNKECEKLNANFGIEITQRAQKGHTLRHLELKGKSPGVILSEGEQRAISIADFLTEIQIGTKNKGIVFDDPVNSLDHKRRQIIAERLIEEARLRQVIVFTHDVTFFLALQTLAEEHNTEQAVTTIRKVGDTPGEIREDIPWVASNVKQKVGRLNDLLQALKKIEKIGDADEYEREAKSWTGLLRETWERSVEEFLFNDAIQRFSPGIQTQRLKKAKYTPALFEELDKGMTECSKWVHDQARALNTPPPNTAKMEQYLEEFKSFAAKFK